jgi:hypothetical protein
MSNGEGYRRIGNTFRPMFLHLTPDSR